MSFWAIRTEYDGRSSRECQVSSMPSWMITGMQLQGRRREGGTARGAQQGGPQQKGEEGRRLVEVGHKCRGGGSQAHPCKSPGGRPSNPATQLAWSFSNQPATQPVGLCAQP
jgi:hypothetical protein